MFGSLNSSHQPALFKRFAMTVSIPILASEYPLLKPLIDLADAGKIPAPGFKISAAHRLNTEVFILAARHDEAVDYRTSIALAYNYPLHQLFIADDNHLFMKLNTRGIHTRLMRTFLKVWFGIFTTEGRTDGCQAISVAGA